MSLHMLGAEIGVADSYRDLYGGLLSGAGTIMDAGIKAYDAKQAEEKAKSDAEAASSAGKKKLAATIAADKAAALALATALTSADFAIRADAKAKAKAEAQASADRAAAEIALAAQARAGAACPQGLAAERVEAAEQGLSAAAAKLQAAPTDVSTQSLVKAWNQVVTRAQGQQIVKEAQGAQRPPAEPKGDGFFSRKIVGPVEVWHVGAAGAAGVGLWWVVKRGVFRRLFGG